MAQFLITTTPGNDAEAAARKALGALFADGSLANVAQAAFTVGPAPARAPPPSPPEDLTAAVQKAGTDEAPAPAKPFVPTFPPGSRDSGGL